MSLLFRFSSSEDVEKNSSFPLPLAFFFSYICLRSCFYYLPRASRFWCGNPTFSKSHFCMLNSFLLYPACNLHCFSLRIMFSFLFWALICCLHSSCSMHLCTLRKALACKLTNPLGKYLFTNGLQL